MDAAYVVDAVDGDVAPGTIVRLEVRQQPWGGLRALSSHGLGLGEAVELGRALGMLPGRLVIYGVVGRSFTHGEGLSPEVLRAAERVVGRLRRAVARRGR
ncbi:MAG: hydrogenase maturation protease [Chloroflexi bacterium]|nr:hydrogenase maturation protease [Chloroflexota bacterium]